MEHTYKHLEITGSSTESSDEAVRNAIRKAGESVRNIHWFEKISERGFIEDDSVKYWQVTLKIGFRIGD